MKKILNLFVFALLVTLVNSGIVSAEITKNFYGYQVKDVNIRQLKYKIDRAIEAYKGDDKFVPLENVKNAYIYTDPNCTYFIRLYPAKADTDIYVVSNEKYDVENNELIEFLKQYVYSCEKIDNKDALREYKFDFFTLARKNELGNFYISPDLVKPLKTGMKKLNNKMAKDNKKTSVFPYTPDKDPIDLDCVDSTNYYDENSKFSFIQNEYRLKQKENKYVHAYEYLVVNKNNSTATVTATSERLAGLKDVTTEAFVDLDRLDLIDTVGTFPPVLICTAGTSAILSVPNWIRLARITAESKRYSNALPENYELKSKGEMRILVLKYKDDPKPIKFNIKFADGTVYNVSF
ncbi:MAG: hypothetical protein K6E29_08595 [Cyanobacteria bacterium RUI128]|nr:hypothetical protein [Cyanobacteria bacterium RUI128]